MMTETSLASPPPADRRPAKDREYRRLRILAMVQAGWSYAAIGKEEGISRERVRQIVAQALEAGAGESKLVHARVQIARLEPALRLAAQTVADGDLAAIDRLLRVLDRPTGSARAATRRARRTRQRPRPPLTRSKSLMSKRNLALKSCQGLTSLDAA